MFSRSALDILICKRPWRSLPIRRLRHSGCSRRRQFSIPILETSTTKGIHTHCGVVAVRYGEAMHSGDRVSSRVQLVRAMLYGEATRCGEAMHSGAAQRLRASTPFGAAMPYGELRRTTPRNL